MISLDILNIDWLESTSEKLNRADKILLEKACRALLLLEGLAGTDLDFVFKGGTAVMLLLEQPNRFSIDIDILTERHNDFEDLFRPFLQKKGFTRLELQNRVTDSDIDKLHYKFFYKPVHRTNQDEENILLDILVEKPQYQRIETVAVDLSFIQQRGKPLQVKIPTVNGLIADKLTAFAPNTTGVPYKKNGQSMSLEIMKQLYDIGKLFKKVDDVTEVRNVFERIGVTELEYRKMYKNVDDVLEDILQTSLCLAARGMSGNGDFKALQTGVRRLKHYIFSESYFIEKAVVHASRAACLACLIRQKIEEFPFYTGPEQVTDLMIENPEMNRLNKLKKPNPEAFFYWHFVSQLDS